MILPRDAQTSARESRRRQRRLTPHLEPFEDRVVLSTLTVTSALDNGASGTLRAVIAAANAGDSIIFSSNLAGQTITLAGQELQIDKSLTITGPSSGQISVDAGGKSRVIDVDIPSLNVTISNLFITGGRGDVAAGILDGGSNLTLNADYVIDNDAIGGVPGESAEGGGVMVFGPGAKLAVNGGEFGGDQADGANGGTSPMSNGQGGDGDGGAIFAGPGTSVAITGAIFAKNVAFGGQGGSGESGSTWNSAGGGYGGAIDSFADTMSATGCGFYYDLAEGGDGSYVEGPPNSSSNSGGPAAGGGIAIDGTSAAKLSFSSTGVISLATASSKTMIFTGDTFMGENAEGGWGGINESPAGSTVLDGSGAPAFGGAIDNPSVVTPLLIQQTTFTSNEAEGGLGADGDVGADGSPGGAVGGAAVASFGDLELIGATFGGNKASGGSGGSGSTGNIGGAGGTVFGGTLFANGNLFVSGNCSFADNVAKGGFGGNSGVGGSVIGGVIDSQGWGSKYTAPFPSSSIASSTFLDNTATGGVGGDGFGVNKAVVGGTGGFVWGGDVCSFGNMAIWTSTFTGGLVAGGLGGDGAIGVLGYGGDGGGDGGPVLGGSLALMNNLIKGGGAGVTDSLTYVSVQDTTAAGGFGGGGYSSGAGGNADGGGIDVSVRSNNPAGHLSVMISSTTISSNTAQAGGGGWTEYNVGINGRGGNALGGGLFVDATSTVSLNGDQIIGNQSDGGPSDSPASHGWGLGGGVYLTGTGSMKKNTTIAGNSASTSGNDLIGAFS